MAEIKKARIITNPRSGRIKIGPKLFDLEAFFSENGVDTTLFNTGGQGDALRYARELAGRYDAVICRGGDGTLNEVMNGVVQSGERRPIGYIPAGTSNDFASTMGIPHSCRAAAQLILSGSPEPHDIGLFNSGRYFNYTACFGAFTSASYATPQRQKNFFGYGAYLTEGIRSISAIKPVKIKITCDGEPLEGDFIFGSVTNALTVGNLIKYDPSGVDFNDGVFEMMLAKKPPTFSGLARLVIDATRKKFDPEYIFFLKGKEFIIESETPTAWSLDGEFGGETESTVISCIKSGISIIKPKI
ncbi:MAG: YegS/Rv2252/BmrU family lipid kinase [Clostridiales bacterium]|nr:YegS/Rv2252/BmrU family lipid kinase [Clostridiales bacterium]